MPPSRIFYGWYVVLAIGLVMTTASGLAFYNLPVLLDAFVTERGFSVGVASTTTGLFFIGSGVGGLLAGQLSDRIDARYVILVSGTVAALALACIGFIHATWQLFLFYGVFGVAFGGCGLVPTTTIVARWFQERRPLALSIASTGLSLGGAVLTPISAYLLLSLGLAGAAPVLGLLFFLGVVPATLLVVRASPWAMGLAPEGRGSGGAQGGGGGPAAGATFAEARRSRFFIALTAAFLFSMGAQVAGIAHLFRLVSTRTDGETAALALALLAVSSLAGRLLVGQMLTYVPARAMTFALIAMQTGTLVLLAFAGSGAALLVSVPLFGCSAGSLLMMHPLLLAAAFGVREYGRIYSASQVISVLGLAAGPFIAGMLYEASGGYVVPYLMLGLFSASGLVFLAAGGPVRH